MAPSSGLTRSSRPQVSRVCWRRWWTSRQSIPSSAHSGFQNDAPIEAIASEAPGAVASANRSSTSSSVTSAWLTTIVEMNARRASLVGSPAKSISRWTPSVGSAWKRFSDSATGPHQHQPADPLGVLEREPRRRTAAEAVAEQVDPVDAELVEQRDEVVGREAEVVADHLGLVGAAEAGLVDQQGAEVLGEAWQRGAEVAPRRGPGTAAVQHHERQPAAERSPASPAPASW